MCAFVQIMMGTHTDDTASLLFPCTVEEDCAAKGAGVVVTLGTCVGGVPSSNFGRVLRDISQPVRLNGAIVLVLLMVLSPFPCTTHPITN
jgi:hypothetical protein